MPEHNRDYPDKAFHPGRQVSRNSFFPSESPREDTQEEMDWTEDQEVEFQSGLTRAQQKTDTIYTTPSGAAFVTPDGEGRYWYDNAEAATAEHGELPIMGLNKDPEDY
jgi:hypothetical protein